MFNLTKGLVFNLAKGLVVKLTKGLVVNLIKGLVVNLTRRLVLKTKGLMVNLIKGIMMNLTIEQIDKKDKWPPWQKDLLHTWQKIFDALKSIVSIHSLKTLKVKKVHFDRSVLLARSFEIYHCVNLKMGKDNFTIQWICWKHWNFYGFVVARYQYARISLTCWNAPNSHFPLW